MYMVMLITCADISISISVSKNLFANWKIYTLGFELAMKRFFFVVSPTFWYDNENFWSYSHQQHTSISLKLHHKSELSGPKRFNFHTFKTHHYLFCIQCNWYIVARKVHFTCQGESIFHARFSWVIFFFYFFFIWKSEYT